MFRQDISDDDECSEASIAGEKIDDVANDVPDGASKAVVVKQKRTQTKRKKSPDCRDDLGTPSEPLKKKATLNRVKRTAKGKKADASLSKQYNVEGVLVAWDDRHRLIFSTRGQPKDLKD